MRLHSLQGVAEHSSAIDLDFAFPGDNRAINGAPRPEVVVHAAPRLLGICAIVAGTVPSTLEAWRSSGELDVDQTAVVDGSLDCVRRAILAQLDGDAIGVEGVVPLIEAVIRQRIARPKERLLVVGVEELRIELHRRARTEDVVVDDLEESNVAALRYEIESLRLDIRIVESLPFEVLLGQLGEGRVACILTDRLDGFRAVDGLLGTGNRGQPVRLSTHIFGSMCTSYTSIAHIHVGAVGKGHSR